MEDFLSVDATFTEIFHPLQIIRTNAARLIDKENRKIENYDYLNNPNYRIFFVEGDPGIGKSTYVSKLAYDWASNSEEICKLFDTIFLIRCSKVDPKLDLPQQICQSIGLSEQEHVNIILEKLKSTRTLIIFDGYDENPLKVVNELIKNPFLLINGMEHYVFAKILVTGRGTHAPIKNENERNEKNVDRLERCDYWLKIMGFSMDDIDGYLTKMNVKDEEKRAILASDSSMKEILGNPLLAMMCASSVSHYKIITIAIATTFIYNFRIFYEELQRSFKEKAILH